MGTALRGVFKYSGKNVGPVVLLRALSVLKDLLVTENEATRLAAARAIGMLSEVLHLMVVFSFWVL